MKSNSQTLLITDNLLGVSVGEELQARFGGIVIRHSPKGTLEIPTIDVRKEVPFILANFDLVISLHCKQMFPVELVRAIRCVNVHPGFNPDNRGWFPQVFSIVNGKRCGATIHEMDEQLDHGAVIAQREYQIKAWDTSRTAYDEVMRIERELLLEHFVAIREGTYRSLKVPEGNLNRMAEFSNLCALDLNEQMTVGAVIDRLRALTHEPYSNAYFIAGQKKVFVGITFRVEPFDEHSRRG